MFNNNKGGINEDAPRIMGNSIDPAGAAKPRYAGISRKLGLTGDLFNPQKRKERAIIASAISQTFSTTPGFAKFLAKKIDKQGKYYDLLELLYRYEDNPSDSMLYSLVFDVMVLPMLEYFFEQVFGWVSGFWNKIPFSLKYTTGDPYMDSAIKQTFQEVFDGSKFRKLFQDQYHEVVNNHLEMALNNPKVKDILDAKKAAEQQKNAAQTQNNQNNQNVLTTSYVVEAEDKNSWFKSLFIGKTGYFSPKSKIINNLLKVFPNINRLIKNEMRDRLLEVEFNGSLSKDRVSKLLATAAAEPSLEHIFNVAKQIFMKGDAFTLLYKIFRLIFQKSNTKKILEEILAKNIELKITEMERLAAEKEKQRKQRGY